VAVDCEETCTPESAEAHAQIIAAAAPMNTHFVMFI
jgi:hypothetical protein